MLNQDLILPDLPTQYEERLVCFIDLLGFKATTDEAKDKPSVLSALYSVLSELEGGRLVSHLHGSVPVLTSDKKFTSAGDADLISYVQEKWPVVATQFSDSFVISCCASNTGSSRMLVRAIDSLQKGFFNQLGMLMRGGISKGPLIHIQGGPLFGPAMNDAYAIESKMAIYPRVVLSSDAAIYLKALWGEGSCPFFTTFDGHVAMDLISCLASRAHLSPGIWNEFSVQLEKVEQDILNNSLSALPKVAYLKDRLRQHIALEEIEMRA